MDPQPPDEGARRIDPSTGLPLIDPYPEYVRCPHCGEPEVEVYCYQGDVVCHRCGLMIKHTPPPGCGTFPFCSRSRPPPDQAGSA